MSQSWPNCQLTIGFHKAGIHTINFYQSFAFSRHPQREIELIDLINNSSSKCRLFNVLYYTCLSLIITTKSKHIELANTRKFISEY